jgi:hypothetical protein
LLAKVLQRMVRARLLGPVQGTRGGYAWPAGGAFGADDEGSG